LIAIFVDTGAWHAVTVPSDIHHQVAQAFLANETERLVTSDLVYSELLTLYRARRQMDRARKWVARIDSGLAEISRARKDDFVRATSIYFEYTDKQWSFTDCVSRVMMQRLAITRAFAFDDHFRQFGTVTVVP
jgi:uncharacterized protein